MKTPSFFLNQKNMDLSSLKHFACRSIKVLSDLEVLSQPLVKLECQRLLYRSVASEENLSLTSFPFVFLELLCRALQWK